MTNHYPPNQACARVMHSPDLKPYFDIICEYSWPNIDEHIDWVCTAPESDILKWAKDIRSDENEAMQALAEIERNR